MFIKAKVSKNIQWNIDHIKGEDPPESIGVSFLKISWLDPEILQFKNGSK